MNDNFYRAFEEKHRGSRELIKSRLRVYEPFIAPLAVFHSGSKAIDLGCGRGEWLEILREFGFQATGLDLDAGMLDACRELELDVKQREAIEFIQELPDSSFAIISGIHLIEHITFSDLQTLVQGALRILQPGGLLILETPNPENMVVAGINFYLDPTHVRPVPPQLLSFLPEYYGFERVKVLRLQEPPGLVENNTITLKSVLNDVSPDYAVVAQKQGSEEIMAATLPAFTREYGVSLNMLTERYDKQQVTVLQVVEHRAIAAETRATEQGHRAIAAETRATEQEHRAIAAETRATEHEHRAIAAETRATEQEHRAIAAETRATEIESALDATRQELHDVHQSKQHHLQLAEARQQQIQSLLSSTSWRLTWPLRALKIALVWLLLLPWRLFKIIAKPLLNVALRSALSRPGLRHWFSSTLKRYPWAYGHLRMYALNKNLMPAGSAEAPYIAAQDSSVGEITTGDEKVDAEVLVDDDPGPTWMTLSARRIYADLKSTIEQRQKENG